MNRRDCVAECWFRMIPIVIISDEIQEFAILELVTTVSHMSLHLNGIMVII